MKEMLESIWQDNKCRKPLNITRWTAEWHCGSTQVRPDLFYSSGKRFTPREGKNHGKKRKS